MSAISFSRMRGAVTLKLVAVALVLTGAYQHLYLTVLFSGSTRAAWQDRLLSIRSGRLPDLPQFLSEVERRTDRGDRLVLVTPYSGWSSGYMYVYYRTAYALPGREVIPVMGPDDQPRPDMRGYASHVVGWKLPPPHEQHGLVHRLENGFLLELAPQGRDVPR